MTGSISESRRYTERFCFREFYGKAGSVERRNGRLRATGVAVDVRGKWWSDVKSSIMVRPYSKDDELLKWPS